MTVSKVANIPSTFKLILVLKKFSIWKELIKNPLKQNSIDNKTWKKSLKKGDRSNISSTKPSKKKSGAKS